MDHVHRVKRGTGRVLRATGREIAATLRLGGIASASYNDHGRHADPAGVAMGLDEVRRTSEDQKLPR